MPSPLIPASRVWRQPAKSSTRQMSLGERLLDAQGALRRLDMQLASSPVTERPPIQVRRDNMVSLIERLSIQLESEHGI